MQSVALTTEGLRPIFKPQMLSAKVLMGSGGVGRGREGADCWTGHGATEEFPGEEKAEKDFGLLEMKVICQGAEGQT